MTDKKLKGHLDKCPRKNDDCLICLAWVRGADTWDEAMKYLVVRNKNDER